MVLMRIGWPVGALLASAMVAGLLPSYQVRERLAGGGCAEGRGSARE